MSVLISKVENWRDDLFAGSMDFLFAEHNRYENLKPVKVIYNKQYTICYWKDGSKTVVKATNDETPTREHGVAMCIMRKLFDTRGEFLKIVNSGHDVSDSQEQRAQEPNVENKRFGFGRKQDG